jgi:phosphate uptake regulator
MKRKINLVGQNTLTVSLPSKWAKEHGLKKGVELDVEEEGMVLKIKTGNSKDRRELAIHIKTVDDFMTRLVCSPFLKGYDSINITYKDSRVYAKILGALKHTVGFEIVDQKDNGCRIEEISKGFEENFDKLITRLFFVIKSFANELNRFLKSPDSSISDLLDIEYTCDKLSLYCRRLINKNIVSGRTYDNTGIYHIVCLAEQIGDEIRQIIEFLKTDDYMNYEYDPRLEKIFSVIDKSLEITLKKVNNYLTEKDHEKQTDYALEQRRLKDDINRERNDFFKMKNENLIILHHLLNSLEAIQHMSEELF